MREPDLGLRRSRMREARVVKRLRRWLTGFLIAVALIAMFPQAITHSAYDQQFRDHAPRVHVDYPHCQPPNVEIVRPVRAR